RIRFEVKNRAIIRVAAFNTKAGSFLTNKRLALQWQVFYERRTNKISFQNQFARIDGHPYRLTGHFLLTNDPSFDLLIETNNLSLQQAASVFPLKTKERINNYKLSRPLRMVKAQLSGPMKYLGIPLARVYFSVNDASVEISTVKFEHCSFKGFYTNEVD